MSEPASRRFVFAHGFTQTSRSWQTISDLLRARVAGAEIGAVDLPGHGGASDQRGDLWSAAKYLLEEGQKGTYVGYSMGGRIALHAALLDPESVERLVLIGATAGIDDDTERAARRSADELLADRLEAIGVEAFIDEWLASPLFGGLTPATDLRDDRLTNTVAGLAESLRSTGTGTQQPLWDRLADIRCPTLVLVGEHDHKFTQIGERLVSLVPHADFAIIPGAGHSVHLESPTETADAIATWWIRRREGGRSRR